MAVLLHTAANDRAVEDIEYGERRGDAVAFIVIRRMSGNGRV